jgi:hypothetical protein
LACSFLAIVVVIIVALVVKRRRVMASKVYSDPSDLNVEEATSNSEEVK